MRKQNTIEQHELTIYPKDYIHDISIAIKHRKFGPIVLSATYCPPKHSISKEFMEYFETLGLRFIARGDDNANHTQKRMVNLTK